MKRINLVNSREWYEEPSQAQAYLDLINGSYGKGIMTSEDNLLKDNLEKIVGMIPTLHHKAHYVDLGPGDGKKTLLLCEAMHRRHKLGAYTAVDIQPIFLEIEKTIGEKFRVPTRAHNCSFEEFLTKTPSFEDMFPWNPRFIYLGSTYGNYSEAIIDKLLAGFMFHEDKVYLSSELIPKSIVDLVSRYDHSLPLFEQVIIKHKLPKGGKLKAIFNEKNSSIEQVYEADNEVYVLGVSKKHSVDSFKNQVSKYFAGQFFVEGAHIGFVGEKR